MKPLQMCLIGMMALVAAGFVSTRSSSSPVMNQSAVIDPELRMPPAVESLVTRACADCHSNQTRWPWYAKIPPGSWLVQSDVNRAKKAMNFSEWSSKNGKTPGSAIGTLSAACADVQSSRMPLPKYLWMHPDAKPQAQDVQAFCDWTHQEVARLASMRRRKSAEGSAK